MVGKDARLTGLAVCCWALAAGVAAAQSLPLVVDGGCREGLPHGRYELRTTTGTLRVAGAFNHGKRTGSFIFWSASGSRIAHIPYDDDARNGTLATWYEAQGAGEPPRRFESTWRHGLRDGLTRTWYRDGRRRTEGELVRGAIVTTAGWSAAGARLSEPAARDAVERDLAAADADYAELEAMVRAHLPHCD
jgi:antitoxin component YwqK of YwqJK toxin-antitoxin module